MNKQLPLLVEIIGPAGAGKSTLLRTLGQQNPALTIFADRLRTSEIRNLPFYVGSGLTALPTLLRPPWSGPWYTREEISRILYLLGMRQVFQRRAQQQGGRLIVLDQGPIFELTHLHGFGPQRLQPQSLSGWWSNLFKAWAPLFTLVVWLDAPDEVLLPRIRTRDQKHIIKQCNDTAARDLLARYRTSFCTVMQQLQCYATIQMLTFHTDQHSLPQIVERTLIEFEHIDNVDNAKKDAIRV